MDIAQFRALYPAFASTPDAAVQQALDEATLFTPSTWGELRERGIGLYAAHSLTLDSQGATVSRTTTSKKVGEVQVSYATQTGTAAWYDLTGYGQRYWALQQRLASGFGAIVV